MAESNLSGKIYSALSERILGLEYPPGHRLVEESLCEEFKVSRSPIREALGMLAENGLVDRKARRGYSVRKIDIREIDELYDLRLVLEAAIVERLCATGMEGSRIARLEERWQALYDGLPQLSENMADADEEFHELLASQAGNRVMQRMLKYVDKRIHFVRLADITSSERLGTTCMDHLAVLGAIRVKDADGAREAIRRNIEWGRKNVEAALKEALIRAYKID
jgi:DNA-binding GntR family transcriptional regulator